MPATNKPTELAVPTTPVPTTPEGVRELLKRAAKGDRATVPALRKLLENPATIDSFGGNLATLAEASFVEAIAGDDLSVREAIHAKLAALRRELSGTDPTFIERLLVGRIVACWLQVQDAEIRYAQNQKNMNIKQADFHQRRMDATNKRYLAAIKTLALVRKLAIPALQINLARKQVNISTPTVVTTGGDG